MTIQVSVGSKIGYGGNAKVKLGGRYVAPVYPWSDDFEDGTIGLTPAFPWETQYTDQNHGLVAAQDETFVRFANYSQCVDLPTGTSVNTGIVQDMGAALPSTGFRAELGIRTPRIGPAEDFVFASIWDLNAAGFSGLGVVTYGSSTPPQELRLYSYDGGVNQDYKASAISPYNWDRPTKIRIEFNGSTRLMTARIIKYLPSTNTQSDSMTIDPSVAMNNLRWIGCTAGPLYSGWNHVNCMYMWAGALAEDWPDRGVETAPY